MKPASEKTKTVAAASAAATVLPWGRLPAGIAGTAPYPSCSSISSCFAACVTWPAIASA